MLDRIKAIYQACDSEAPVMPPTMLFNEGWLLRLVLDWFLDSRVTGHALSIRDGHGWYSEALLRSQFLPRYRGDPLSESRTHADAAIGNFIIADKDTSELRLLPDSDYFVVLEAKIYSRLSPGVTHASYYDQAARYVACLAELLGHASLNPMAVGHLAFHVLAPRSQIESGVFAKELTRESIYHKVERRVNEYAGDKNPWFDEWFKPTLNKVDISAISWEEVIAFINNQDNDSGKALEEFYSKCLECNSPYQVAQDE